MSDEKNGNQQNSEHRSSAPRVFAAPQVPVNQRVGVFVDVQNMFYSAKILHQSKVDYGRLLKEITLNRQLIRAIAYIVQKPEVNQTGFHDALYRMGYELKVKELKITNRNDGGTTAKGSWDVGMTIDVMTLAPKLDTVILVTGDGEFVPLVEAVRNLGCRVEVVSFERSTSGLLIKSADHYIPIQDQWIFKEKKFERVPDEHQQPVNAESGLLGSTAPGKISPEALPKDDDPETNGSVGAYDPDAIEDESPLKKKKKGVLGGFFGG
jgi:uncharacterized LabA/DUF88 family protein